MSQEVFLTHYQQTPFGVLSYPDLEAMTLDVVSNGLKGIDPNLVEGAAFAGALTPVLHGQSLISGLCALHPGLDHKPIKGITNACDSGGVAVVDCVTEVLAGQADVMLAIGIEKMHPFGGEYEMDHVYSALGTAAHKYDKFPPATFPAAFARVMKRYMETYGYSEADFACIPPLFYANAAHNPLAHKHKENAEKGPVTPEKVLKSRPIFKGMMPLKLYECSQVSDGGATILVCNEVGLKKLGIPMSEAVRVVGFGRAVDGLSIRSRGDDLLKPVGANRAFGAAMLMASISPEDLSVVEVHDCFSIMAALAVEIMDLAVVGQGLRYFMEGHANLDGACPVNTYGGLIAMGHPISASGLAMFGKLTQQLLGKAPAALQARKRDFGALLNIGGPICSTVAAVLAPAN
jgi:acetyl-CoA C-acetyltransferase